MSIYGPNRGQWGPRGLLRAKTQPRRVSTVLGVVPSPPPPVSFPTLCRSRGGGGASLGQPKIFLCGSLCCCVGGCVVGHYHLHPLHSWQGILLTFAEMELDNTGRVLLHAASVHTARAAPNNFWRLLWSPKGGGGPSLGDHPPRGGGGPSSLGWGTTRGGEGRGGPPS